MDAALSVLQAHNAWSSGEDPVEAALQSYRLLPMAGGSAVLGAVGGAFLLALVFFLPVFANFIIVLRWLNRTYDPTYLRCALASAMTAPALILFFIAAVYLWTALTGYKIPAPVRDISAVIRAALLFGVSAIAQILTYRALAPVRRLGEYVGRPPGD